MATVLGALPDDTSWEDTFDEATSVLSISVEAPVEVSPIEHLQVTADDDLDDAEDGGFSRSSDSDSVSGEVICRLPAGTPEAPHVALQKVILAPWIGAWSALLATQAGCGKGQSPSSARWRASCCALCGASSRASALASALCLQPA